MQPDYAFRTKEYHLDIDGLKRESEKLFHDYKRLAFSWSYLGMPLEERFNRVEVATKKFEFSDYHMQFDLPLLNQRFSDISCLKKGRVPPYTYTSFITQDLFGNKYDPPKKIQVSYQQHANFVHLCGLSSICAQYPLESETEGFWNTVITNGKLIVDLTKIGESNPCYYPTLNIPHKLFQREICFYSCEEISDDFIKTTYKVYDTFSKNCEETRTDEHKVIRLHYQGWQDQSGIDIDSLDRLTRVISSTYNELNTSLPFTIHCLAGVGRTGTVFNCMAAQELVRKKEITKENYLPMIDALILTGRYQRGNYFVQKASQYTAIVNLIERNLGV